MNALPEPEDELIGSLTLFLRGGVPLQDLIQEGTIGRIRAVDKFDRRHGVRRGRAATRAERLLANAIAELPARERHVLTQRYASPPAKLADLAGDLGVCHQRVAQLEEKALFQLRRIVAKAAS
jgi:DNA-directed RNA polymerase sigma subunit (sigma70/sigma32)